jgi:hypothetical protein
MDSKAGPIVAMILGGLLLMAGAFVRPSEQRAAESLQGTLLICVHEKQRPSVDEVIAIREAKEFVTKHGFKGHLVIDQDDENAQSLLKAAESKKVTPPFIAAGDVVDGKITQLRKVVPWAKGLEDILK